MEIYEKKYNTTILVVAVISFILGGLLSSIYFYKEILRFENEAMAIQVEADKTINNLKMFVPEQIMSISGRVTKINGNFLFVEAIFPGGKKVYEVKIIENTKIIKRELPQTVSSGVPVETIAGMSDIKAGETIFVSSLEDIKDKLMFEANELAIIKLIST